MMVQSRASVVVLAGGAVAATAASHVDALIPTINALAGVVYVAVALVAIFGATAWGQPTGINWHLPSRLQ